MLSFQQLLYEYGRGELILCVLYFPFDALLTLC